METLHDKSIFTQYLSTNLALQRIMGGKYQHKTGNHTVKKINVNLSSNTIEDSYTTII